MAEMTSFERFSRMYEHREADRVPIIDQPWEGTIRRWRKEGMPRDMDWRDFFGIDKVEGLGFDISPRFPWKVIEETDKYVIQVSSFGVTSKQFKEADSTPEFLDYKVQTPEAWEEAKSRMVPSRDRINWDYYKRNYATWRAEGRWIQSNFWFGFDVTHSHFMGLETVLIAMLEQPEWIKEVFNTYLDMCIAHSDMLWDAGFTFDCVSWPDDMGYKNTSFFSKELYREILKPIQKRAVDYAHSKGIYAHLHSCGNIMGLLPDVLETGIDALNPLEVKAGMDGPYIKEKHGDRLVLHGGINAVLWDDKEKVVEEIRRLVPIFKENGGYIFSSDHSIPNTVSLENFQEIIKTVKEVGSY